MTQLVPDARCPVCGLPLLITFRTVGPEQKTFEYHHDRIPSFPCVVTILQPDVDHYEEMVYAPLIRRSETAPAQ
jgi:hypothetical protein